MRTKVFAGHIIAGGGNEWVDGALVVEGDRVAYVGPRAQLEERWVPDIREISPGWTVVPGLVDVHCHGGGGASFPDATSMQQVIQAAEEHLRNGTTTLIASLVTAPLDVLEQRAALLADACEKGIIAGIHYEGPFLSAARCGAQDPRYLIDATGEAAQRLVEAARGHAVSMTFAPEKAVTPQGRQALEVLIKGGVLPSWGHTDAGIADTQEAISLGMIALAQHPVRGGRASVTHLFNGMRPMHHRDPGPISAYLEAASRGEVVAEMIDDGTHLDPDLVRKIVGTIGAANSMFVTDAMAAAGMPDGDYQLGPQAVTVTDSVARLTNGGAIAGGTARLVDCVRTAATKGKMPLAEAIDLATHVPAQFLGDPDIGVLASGKRANLVALDGQLKVVGVMRGGQTVTGKALR